MKHIAKRTLGILLAFVLLVSLAACGNPAKERNSSADNSSQPGTSSSNEQASDPLTDSEAPEDENTDAAPNGSNILVAFFSLAGEQYNVGVIEEGNTSIIAHMIAEQTGADLFEIEAVTPYPNLHSELLDISQQERTDNVRPEIVETIKNLEDYDTIFIGYPIWWADMPMIVYNFLESYDFSGKIIVPFCTHGGSRLAGTENTIASICSGAEMLDGFAISGETAQNDRERSNEEVTEWLREGGFVES